MKKSNRLLLTVALLLLLSLSLTLSSCKEATSPVGDLTIDFADSNDKSILPTSVAVTWIQISGTRNDNNTIAFIPQNFQLGSPMKITDLSVGTWTINVVGYGGNPSEGFPALTSVATDANVVIQSGQTTSAAFVLQYLTTGIGSFKLTVNWPVSLLAFAKVEVVLNNARWEGAIAGSSATITGDLSVGDYPVDIVFTNFLGTQISFTFMEMVNVYNALTSTGTIPFEEADFTQAAIPIISNTDTIGGQQISISSTTSDSTIYYTTDGTDPTTSGTKAQYIAPFTITKTKSVRAVAIKSGMVNSAEASKEVVIAQVAAPVITPSEETFSGTVEVTMSSSTSDASIHYTTDGSEPTIATNLYIGAITLPATTTLKAVAIRSGMINSTIVSKQYTLQQVYTVGSTGPAGGKIFFVNPNSATDGWKYLEAAPADEATTYIYGGYGTRTWATATAIGMGQANTTTIVNVLKTVETGSYAAKVCDDKSVTYNGKTYADWFLPSKDELNEMYINRLAIGGFFDSSFYWSSTEDPSSNAWFQSFSSGAQYYSNRNNDCRVRPVRAFL